MTEYRDYTYLGMTQSLCPECLAVVPAKICSRDGRVYFRKTCVVHGIREDFVCSDVHWFDRAEFSLPDKIPLNFGSEPQQGCPYDCGLCTEHEQHTCIGLLEITSSCNLECPMCFSVSGPGGKHLTFDECRTAIDRLVEVEGQPEILQLSGGEPTIHPEFHRIHQYACDQPIDIVMINTNGIRFAKDRRFLDEVAQLRQRTEIYLQFDGFRNESYQSLRGESLADTKLATIEALGEAGLDTILVCTVQPDVNEDQIGEIVDFAVARPWITGVSFQPATYSGRYFLPEQLERRTTFPDIIKAIANQTNRWQSTDFTPLPCAHPNAHTLSYAYRSGNSVVPIARFLQLEQHLDLLSGRITFDRPRARRLVEEYLSRQVCGLRGCAPEAETNFRTLFDRGDLKPLNHNMADFDQATTQAAQEFLMKTLTETLTPANVFRITTTSFMDAYNFDVRQLMKSCVHFVLPSGHIIPFSAYNVLYRNGHVPLPPLTGAACAT